MDSGSISRRTRSKNKQYWLEQWKRVYNKEPGKIRGESAKSGPINDNGSNGVNENSRKIRKVGNGIEFRIGSEKSRDISDDDDDDDVVIVSKSQKEDSDDDVDGSTEGLDDVSVSSTDDDGNTEDGDYRDGESQSSSGEEDGECSSGEDEEEEEEEKEKGNCSVRSSSKFGKNGGGYDKSKKEEVVENGGDEESESYILVDDSSSDEEDKDEVSERAKKIHRGMGKMKTEEHSYDSNSDIIVIDYDDNDDNDDANDTSIARKRKKLSSDEEDEDEVSERTKKIRRGKGKMKKKEHSYDSNSDVIVIDYDDDDANDTSIARKGKQSGKNMKKKKDDNDNDDEDGGDDVNHNSIARKGKKSKQNMKVNMKNDDDEEEDEDEDAGDGDLTYSGIRNKGKKAGKSSVQKRKGMAKHNNAQKILISSILDKEKTSPEESLCSNQPAVEALLPQIFTFGIVKSTPAEKSDHDKELEDLFTEADYARGVNDMGLMDKDEEVVSSKEDELDQATCCHQGDHDFVLDEEIGTKCRFCSYVQTEIRYVTAPFATRKGERYDWRDRTMADDHSLFEKLRDHGSGLQSNHDLCSDAKGTVWDLVPGTRKELYEHQREGYEFIWKIVAGGINLDELRNNTEGGCVISHAPGTGKTRLTLVFLQAYMTLYPMSRPVIVAPRSMLLTWEEEFKKWKINIPFHNLNSNELSGHESPLALESLEGARSAKLIRLVKLFSWKNHASVLGISYQLFQKIVGFDKINEKANKKEKEDMRVILLELPGLFVFDEGHTARNKQSNMFKALSEIKTKRRIILSGTPFQNNFEELYNTFWLVRPDLENESDSGKKRGPKRNQLKQKHLFRTSAINKADGRSKDEKVKEVRELIFPYVHRVTSDVLLKNLPGLKHYMVVLKPEPSQASLLKDLEVVLRDHFSLDYLSCLVSVHPSLLLSASKKENLKVEKPKLEKLLEAEKSKLEKLRLHPEAGVKTKFLMELLHLSNSRKEKVLVFSQYLEPLALIKDQLNKRFNWSEGHEILYMDGQQKMQQRQSSINTFNDKMSGAKILLASTRACSEGISLVGASRVLLLDITWNPSVETQAINRAFRLGQEKMVYVYHLITSESMEKKKFNQQARKDLYSRLVFESSDDDGNIQQESGSGVVEDDILNDMRHHDKMKHIFEDVIYRPQSVFIFGEI